MDWKQGHGGCSLLVGLRWRANTGAEGLIEAPERRNDENNNVHLALLPPVPILFPLQF